MARNKAARVSNEEAAKEAPSRAIRVGAMAKKLYEWNVIRPWPKTEFIGCVEAPDEMAAIQVAIEQFRTSEGAGSRLRWTKMPIAR